MALAWLENYLATSWEGTVLVVSHDRAFLDIVGTDIIHQHNQRLDYYKGASFCELLLSMTYAFVANVGNFTQFYATKEERALQQKREYDAQQMFRANLQAFIDRSVFVHLAPMPLDLNQSVSDGDTMLRVHLKLR